MGAHRFACIALLLVACGDDSPSGTVDAPINPMIDAFVPTPDAPMAATCAYIETADATNNTQGGAEMTNLTFAGPNTALCGSFNSGHFDATNEVIDADRFTFTTGANYDVLVHLTGAGAEAFDDVAFQINAGTTTTRVAVGFWEGDHATLATHLPAGTYTLILVAFNASAASASIDYKLELRTDGPSARCPQQTTGGFTEAGDTGNTGNDVIRHDFAGDPQSSLTAASDNPEATNLTLAAGSAYRISGTSANVDANNDSYKDRDTYAITTGATTTQLTVRLNWPGTTTDLDYRIYQQNTASSYAAGVDAVAMQEEFETFAVRPNTTYWLWIAADDGSTGVPVDYEASLCAETFVP